MNNSKTVSEKEITTVIESLDDTVNDLKKKCHQLLHCTESLDDDVSDLKKRLNTSSSIGFIEGVDKKVLSLLEKEKNILQLCEAIVVDVNYTSVQDETVRGIYGE